MVEWYSLFQEVWAVRALISSSLVGVMCGVLGCFIVLRNMSMIGDALSHAILPGIVFAFMLVGYSVLGFFVGAVLAGLVAAVGITWIQQKVKTKNDAAIGIVFTAMFSIGVMGISWISRNEGVHLDLKDFLFGNILGVSDQDLYLTAGITLYVLLSVVVFYRYLFASTFQPVIAQTMGISVELIHYFLMLLLSFAVVASLQTVGVILVVAMLITPASTALLLANRLHWVVVLAAIIGLLSAVVGFIGAVALETTPGPAMAVTATLFYLLAVFFAPQKGLLFKGIQKRKLRRKIQREDILKQAYRLQQKGELNQERLLNQLELRSGIFQKQLKILKNKGYFQSQGLKLTADGEQEAKRLVRAHRLLETYLVDQIGVSSDRIHEEAEKYEHLFSEELLDEMDKELGFPATDPHGSPIPTKVGQPDYPLSRLKEQQYASIADQQINEHVTTKLWSLGLMPGMDFTVKNRSKEELIILLQDQKELSIPNHLAHQINVALQVS